METLCVCVCVRACVCVVHTAFLSHLVYTRKYELNSEWNYVTEKKILHL
jgi:hypothetical protein